MLGRRNYRGIQIKKVKHRYPLLFEDQVMISETEDELEQSVNRLKTAASEFDTTFLVH
jgi:hypothetical protein